jgi:hypothetical protein
VKQNLSWRAVAAALAVATALPAAACGFDGLMVDLTAAHPQSIGVALAVRDALDRNELTALQPLPGVIGFMRANRMLHGFSPMVGELTRGTPASVVMLLVESGLWTRYSFDEGRVTTWPHVAGALPGEQVIVTSESVLDAVVRGTLAPARAVELGVLVVDIGTG